jgi:hypothetical protein
MISFFWTRTNFFDEQAKRATKQRHCMAVHSARRRLAEVAFSLEHDPLDLSAKARLYPVHPHFCPAAGRLID